MDVQQGSWN